MSSICGLLSRDGRPVERAAVDAMVASLSHWGPDATGAWSHDTVGLGHAALWTTPEARLEPCPWTEPAAGITVTADVRLDHREELIARLGLRPLANAPIGDCELIARAYLRWGTDCVDHLIGDFAFALWDGRNRRLFCARDALGVRPFYYFIDARRFLFGTEIKAIFTAPDISRDPDPLRFALFLLGGKLERDHTQFRVVRMLEPACAMVVDATSVRQWRYWRLDPENELRLRRDTDYVDAFEALFQRAIDDRLRCPAKVGSMLSGGLDATLVTRFASRSARPPPGGMMAYTWALPPGDPWPTRDERDYVDTYLRAAPLPHRYLLPDATRVFDDAPHVRHLQDGPIWHIGNYALEDTFSTARADGVRVLLFGDGGDEIASYDPPNFLLGAACAGDWRALSAEARWFAAELNAPLWRGWKNHVLRRVVEALRAPEPFSVQDRLGTFRAVVDERHTGHLYLAEELVRAADLVAYLESRRESPAAPSRHLVRRRQIDGITGSNALADIATHKYNPSVLSHVECRYPFLDRRVVEFCVALPAAQHRQAGWSRRLVRQTAARHIPAHIAWRKDKSPTLADYDRGVCHGAAKLQQSFRRWAEIPAVTSSLRVPRLQADLERILAHSRSGSMLEARNFGGFCRAVFLASFLEKNPGCTLVPPA